jgi:hypothetical protein
MSIQNQLMKGKQIHPHSNERSIYTTTRSKRRYEINQKEKTCELKLTSAIKKWLRVLENIKKNKRIKRKI